MKKSDLLSDILKLVASRASATSFLEIIIECTIYFLL